MSYHETQVYGLDFQNDPSLSCSPDKMKVAMVSSSPHYGLFLALLDGRGNLIRSQEQLTFGQDSAFRPRCCWLNDRTILILYGCRNKRSLGENGWYTVRLITYDVITAQFSDREFTELGALHGAFDQNDLSVDDQGNVWFLIVDRKSTNKRVRLFKNYTQIKEFPTSGEGAQHPIIRYPYYGWRNEIGYGSFTWGNLETIQPLTIYTTSQNARWGLERWKTDCYVSLGRNNLLSALYHQGSWTKSSFPIQAQEVLGGVDVVSNEDGTFSVVYLVRDSGFLRIIDSATRTEELVAHRPLTKEGEVCGVRTFFGMVIAATIGDRDVPNLANGEWRLRTYFKELNPLTPTEVKTVEGKVCLYTNRKNSRFLDSRIQGGIFNSGEIRTYTAVAGDVKTGAWIPPEAVAIIARLTQVRDVNDYSGGNIVTFAADIPEHERPDTSHLNWWASGDKGASDLVFIPLSSDKRFSVKCNAGKGHLIIDLFGYILPD